MCPRSIWSVGYNNANASPILKLFLSRIDDLIAQVSSNRPRVKPEVSLLVIHQSDTQVLP